MAAVVGKYAAKKMLGKQMDKYRDKDVVPYVSRSLSRQFAKRKRIPKKKTKTWILHSVATILSLRRAALAFLFLFYTGTSTSTSILSTAAYTIS